MDTQKSINDLQVLSDSLKKEGNDKLGLAQLIDISISQLNGVLETQATALKAEYEATITDQAKEIEDKDQIISDLQESPDLAVNEEITP